MVPSVPRAGEDQQLPRLNSQRMLPAVCPAPFRTARKYIPKQKAHVIFITSSFLCLLESGTPLKRVNCKVRFANASIVARRSQVRSAGKGLEPIHSQWLYA